MSFYLFVLNFDGFCSRNEYLASSSETNFRPFGNGDSVLWLLKKALVACIKQEDISFTYVCKQKNPLCLDFVVTSDS